MPLIGIPIHRIVEYTRLGEDIQALSAHAVRLEELKELEDGLLLRQ